MNLLQTIITLFIGVVCAREFQRQAVSDYVELQLNIEYDNCLAAWNDVSRWCIVIYGDWYGNRGGNTLVYYLNRLLFDKIPRWISLCYR